MDWDERLLEPRQSVVKAREHRRHTVRYALRLVERLGQQSQVGVGLQPLSEWTRRDAEMDSNAPAQGPVRKHWPLPTTGTE